ncbi:MAG: hypothetical protein A2096_00825 [Spirochaetes bacterium GWF1_41_5]|nr:MAG: hypothetical protein A2096_00825 [Spirochaetes bacterium GWF1_41_5]HBE03535.1 hypothetical protein [Spirochaetia bacterium]
MKIINHLESCRGIKSPCIITIGNFDGVHLGHRQLLAAMSSWRRENPGISISAVTFRRHTKSENRGRYLLLPFREKMLKLAHEGIDYLFNIDFNEAVKNMPWDAFIGFLRSRINIKCFAFSSKLHFGHERTGNAENLGQYCTAAGIDTLHAPIASLNGPVSSTIIRGAVTQADFNTAGSLLGYRYFISGRVCRGQAFGRKLGFPTINIIPPDDLLLPPDGAYIISALINRRSFPGAAFVGTKKEKKIIEAHLLNFSNLVYNQYVRIEFYQFLRTLIKTQNNDELKKLISNDVEKARDYFNNK